MNEPRTNSGDQGFGAGRLVFVVDDEPMLLELALIILQPQGFTVKTFRDPELACESFGQVSPRPDLIISDYAMHSMNGMELVERLRSIEPKIKILLVSGTVGEEVFRNAPSKPDRFLAKPYQPRQLLDAIRSLIG